MRGRDVIRVLRARRVLVVGAFCLAGACQIAWAQSSSLYVQPANPGAGAGAAPAPGALSGERLSSSLARASLAAVLAPEPREFAVHDLVTIIVRESTENDSDASLDTKKDTKFNGEVSAFPNLDLHKLLAFQLGPKDFPDGTPKLGVNFKSDFKGDGDYRRKDSFTSRITSRIIDVKPNGTLVLEARKHIRTDKETLTMTLTGTCRKQDITADNTVLSTQMFDLNLDKQHSGELRKASKKGWLTRALEGVFNF